MAIGPSSPASNSSRLPEYKLKAKLYKKDTFLKEFHAVVLKLKGDKVELTRTAYDRNIPGEKRKETISKEDAKKELEIMEKRFEQGHVFYSFSKKQKGVKHQILMDNLNDPNSMNVIIAKTENGKIIGDRDGPGYRRIARQEQIIRPAQILGIMQKLRVFFIDHPAGTTDYNIEHISTSVSNKVSTKISASKKSSIGSEEKTSIKYKKTGKDTLSISAFQENKSSPYTKQAIVKGQNTQIQDILKKLIVRMDWKLFVPVEQIKAELKKFGGKAELKEAAKKAFEGAAKLAKR